MDYPIAGADPMRFIPANKMAAWQWLGFAVIAFFVFLVYFPSLMHVPRADQIMYLGEVAKQDSFWQLAINDYDLNRHRTIAPGDELLSDTVLISPAALLPLRTACST